MPDKAIDVLDEACARSRVREHGGHGDGEAAAPGAAQTVITPESVMEVISLMSGIPLTKLTITETDRLLGLADKLRERVVGQVRRPTTLAPHNGRPRRHAVLRHAAPPRLACCMRGADPAPCGHATLHMQHYTCAWCPTRCVGASCG
jgi:hypothetical protein